MYLFEWNNRERIWCWLSSRRKSVLSRGFYVNIDMKDTKAEDLRLWTILTGGN